MPPGFTNHPASEETPAWTRDSTKIAFSSNRDTRQHVFSMNFDGAGLTQLTSGFPAHLEPAWSPEGHKVVFRDDFGSFDSLSTRNSDGTGNQFLASSQTSVRAPTWSPAGEPIAYDVRGTDGSALGIWKVTPDGSGKARLVPEGFRPDWSPDGHELVFDMPRGLAILDVESGAYPTIPDTAGLTDAVFSPDGTRLAATDGTAIYTMNLGGTDRTLVAAGTAPSWQAIDPPPFPGPAYPRPRGATPLQIPLVPVYVQCVGAPNNAHGASLAFPSCSPPQLGTWNLTMGTPDANGAGARFVGSLFMRTVIDDPDAGPDEADVRITADVTDVRCKFTVEPEPGTEGFPCTAGEMADYTGELAGNPLVRITDMRNGWEANRAGTTRDLRFPFAIPCAATSLDSVGATCNAATTFNSVLPGAIQGGSRAVLAIQRADVYDGGVDGAASTQANNGPFVTQGLFVP